MKKIVILFMGIGFSMAALAQNFSPANLVVFRAGDGTASIATNIAAPIFLDEFTTSGTLVQSLALPTTTVGSNKRIFTSGTSTSEGQITRSVNGLYIFAVGYDATVGTFGTGTTSLSGSASATTNRIVARLDNAKNINTTTALADLATGGNARSCVSDDGTNIWCVGATGGVIYNTIGATSASNVVSNTVTNLRTINIFNGQLYVGTGSGTNRIASVGAGLPTATGQTLTPLAGISSTNLNSPYQFLLFDMDATVAGVDVLYLVDDLAITPGISKYSLVGGTWVSNGVVDATTGYRGLAGAATGSTVNLFAVKGGNTLLSLTDASGYNGNFTATPNTIATAPTGTAFRGVCFAPSATALPLNLLSFNAATVNNQVNLWWSTSNEINTANFEIQQSNNAVDFNSVASVVSKNTTQLNSYQYSVSAKNGFNYYRLKMMDKDGKFTYSSVVKIEDASTVANLSIYPNPATNSIAISHSAAVKNTVITITTSLGKSVVTTSVDVNETTTKIDISNLPKGLYSVSYQTGDSKVVSKFIKQ